jgi:hypothetical protein
MALAVGVEADGDAVVVQPEELVRRAGGVRVDDDGPDPVLENEAEVVSSGFGVEAACRAGEVDSGDLGLLGAREILVGAVALAVRSVKEIALVRVRRGGRAAAEVAGNGRIVVDGQQLVERLVLQDERVTGP